MEPRYETSETPQKMDMNDLSNQSESTELVQHQAATMELFHMEALLSAQTTMTELLENGKAIVATNSTVPLTASENAILLAKHKSLVRVFKASKYLNAIRLGMSKTDTSSAQSAVGQSAGAAVPSSTATTSTTSADNPENKSDALTIQDVSKSSSAIATAPSTIASCVSTEHMESKDSNEPAGDTHNIIVPCFHIKDGLEHLLNIEEKVRHEAEQRAALLAAQQQQQRNMHRPNPQPRQPRPAAVPFRRQASADSLSIQGFSAIASYLDRIPFAMPTLTYVNRRESLPTTTVTTTSTSSSLAAATESTAADGAIEVSVEDAVRAVLQKMVSIVECEETLLIADDAARLLKWEETWSSAIVPEESENKPNIAEGQKASPQLQCLEAPEESPPPPTDGSQPTLQSDGQSQTPLQALSQPETRPPNRVYMNLGDLGMREGWTTVWTNPCYCIDDCPVEGWRKEISVKINGKLRGSVDVYYITPSRDKRIKNKSELQLYFSQNNLPFDQISLFNFAATFCVCQDIEKDDYIECSFGKSGCNGWIHPQCVSVDRAVENYNHDQLGDTVDRVICPLCTLYLEATGDLAAHCDFDTMVMRCSDKLLELRPPRQFVRPKRPLPTIVASAISGPLASSSNSFAGSGQTSTFTNSVPLPLESTTLGAVVQTSGSSQQKDVVLVIIPIANSVTEINGFKVEEYSEYCVTQNEHYLINAAAILKAQEESDLRAVQLVLMDLVEAVAWDGGEEGPTDLAGTTVVEPMTVLKDGTSSDTASSSLSTAPLSLLSPMQSAVASTMVKQPHIDISAYSSLHSKRPLDSSVTVTHNLLQQGITEPAFHSHNPAKPIAPSPSASSVPVTHNLFNPNTLLSSIIPAPASKRAKTESAASLNNIFQHRLFQFNAVPVSSTTTADAAETTGVSRALIQTGPEAVITNQRPKYLSGDALLPMFQSNSGKSAKRPRASTSKHGRSKYELHSEDSGQHDSDDDDDSDAPPRVSKEEVALWKNKFDPQTRVYEYTLPPPPQSDTQQDKPPVEVVNRPAAGDVSENLGTVDEPRPEPTDDVTSNQSDMSPDNQLDSTSPPNKQESTEECEVYAPYSNNSHCSYAATKCRIRVTGGWMKDAKAKSRDKTPTNHILGKVPDIHGISNHTNGQNDIKVPSLDHKLLRQELIALNHHIAHSAPKRRKTSHSNAVTGDDNNKDAAYCFIPLLDGGVRYTCVSYGDFTVDFADDRTCGFCCSDCSDTAAAVAPDTTTVQKGKKRKNAAVVVDPLADRYQLVPYFGSKSDETNRVTPNTCTEGETAFSCHLHKQCLHMVDNWEAASREHLFPSPTSECRVNVLDLVECSDLINTKESESHYNDDETPYVCSLCAKTGVHGLMVHYTIAPSRSSGLESTVVAGELVTSTDESLPLRIAHIPCLYHLYHSIDMYGITDEQLLSKDATADDADKMSVAAEGGESDREDMGVVAEASLPQLLLLDKDQTVAVDELKVAKDEENENSERMSTCAEAQEVPVVDGSDAKDDSLLAADGVIDSSKNAALGGVHETRSPRAKAALSSAEEVRDDDAPETTTVIVNADNAVDPTDESDSVEKMVDATSITTADCGMKTTPSDDEVEKEAKESASGNEGHDASISEPETNSESPSNSTGAQRTVIKHVTGSFSNDLRCCLCGVKSGLVVRCSVVNCFTAAHPFCVSSTSANNKKAARGPKGQFYKVFANDGNKEQEASSYICSVHAL